MLYRSCKDRTIPLMEEKCAEDARGIRLGSCSESPHWEETARVMDTAIYKVTKSKHDKNNSYTRRHVDNV